MREIKKTSTIVYSMNRARNEAIRGINDTVSYHRRQIEILFQNRCEGAGEPENKIFSRPVLELRREMLTDISNELINNMEYINQEIIDIDISLKNDIFSDKESIIYDQRDRSLPVSQKRR